jgi:predicted AAA+ superfamily ATPase
MADDIQNEIDEIVEIYNEVGKELEDIALDSTEDKYLYGGGSTVDTEEDLSKEIIIENIIPADCHEVGRKYEIATNRAARFVKKHIPDRLEEFEEAREVMRLLIHFEDPSRDGKINRWTVQYYSQRVIHLLKIQQHILLSIPEIIENEKYTPGSSSQDIINLFGRFHKVAQQLENRYNDRKTLSIRDEHDVQNLVHSLLWLEFDDVRKEEQSPSHGGSASRIDFLVKDKSIGIEIKYAGGSKEERKLKNEIAEDKEHYKAHPDCEELICFIYNPELSLENPTGFEDDLSDTDGPLSTNVVVFPK